MMVKGCLILMEVHFHQCDEKIKILYVTIMRVSQNIEKLLK